MIFCIAVPDNIQITTYILLTPNETRFWRFMFNSSNRKRERYKNDDLIFDFGISIALLQK